MMLGRTVRPAVNAVSRQSATPLAQQRNMATLREIEQRLKSVRNIEKITKVRLKRCLQKVLDHH